MGWIYLIRNQVNGKCYVGQTTSDRVNDRWRYERYRPHGCLKYAFEKYGIDKFSFETICKLPIEELDDREILEIRERNTIVPNGYNIESGGNNNKTLNQETKTKLSILNSGVNHPMYGTKRSDATKLKISEKNKGKSHPVSEETKQKLREINSGSNHPMFGKPREDMKKRVEQFKNDEWILHQSISDAATSLGLKSPAGIGQCCMGKRKTAGGFTWRFHLQQ